jgi:hypothetical protein
MTFTIAANSRPSVKLLTLLNEPSGRPLRTQKNNALD